MYKSNLYLKSMVVIFLLSMGYFISITLVAVPKIKSFIQTLEEEKVRIVLNEVVSLSNAVCRDIKYFPKVTLKIQKENLKHLNNFAFSVAQNNYEKYKKHQLTQSQAKSQTYKEISKFHYGAKGYFFVVDDNYKVLWHPNKALLSTDASKIKDASGNYFVESMIDQARVKGDSFSRYMWKKGENKFAPKLSYIEKFEPWSIYIGTGVFIDNITSVIQKRKEDLYNNLYHKVSHITIANSGYVYILNSKGDMIYHPDKKLQGTNVRKIKNPTKETYLFDDLVKAYKDGRKELHYLWNKPNDPQHYIYEKVAWIEYVKDLDWYMISSVYLDEFQDGANKLNNSLFVIGLSLLFIMIIIASIFFKRIDLGIAKNTQDLINAKQKLKDLANIDMLTGLYNRRYLYYIVPKIVSLAKREKKPLSLLMIDLDKFKHINDTYGHANGDKVLERFAKILIKHTRESDIVVRVGGEEFLVLLNNTPVQDAIEVANKIRLFTQRQCIVTDAREKVNFTISIGVDSVDLEKESNIDKAYIRADKALYDAKEKGRNRVCP